MVVQDETPKNYLKGNKNETGVKDPPACIIATGQVRIRRGPGRFMVAE